MQMENRQNLQKQKNNGEIDILKNVISFKKQISFGNRL